MQHGDGAHDAPARSPGPRMVRLFIALETNEAMQQAMAAAQRVLRQRGDLPVGWARRSRHISRCNSSAMLLPPMCRH